MSSTVGERLFSTGRYIKHPDVGSSWSQNGDPEDAATAMVRDNNLHHLVAESQHHWVADPHPAGGLSQTDYWGNLVDSSPNPGSWTPPHGSQQISWDQRSCVTWGPFSAIGDRILSNGRIGLRKIKCVWTAETSVSLKVYTAMTVHGLTPADGFLAFDEQTITSGPTTKAIELASDTPVMSIPRVPWRCRVTGARGAVANPAVISVSLWLGWYFTSIGTINFNVFNAYEIP